MQKLLIMFSVGRAHKHQTVICDIPQPFVVFTNCIGGKHNFGRDYVENQLKRLVSDLTDINVDKIHITSCDIVTVSESLHCK